MTTETEKDRRARETIEALTQQIAEVRDERDALAAHVERLQTAWRQYEDSEYCSEDEIKAEEQLYALMEEAPPPPLARRDARVAADALDSCADELIECGHDAAAQVARSRARLSRHQAEGGDHA